jgi:hypothetical protein
VAGGTDFFFLDASGVRLLNRTIQEKSVPVGDVSKNVRDDLTYDVSRVTREDIRGVYSPEEAFYLLLLPRSEDAGSKVYCFDTRQPLEMGAYRVTTWNDKQICSGARAPDGSLYLGHQGGAHKYFGASDTYDIVGVEDLGSLRK